MCCSVAFGCILRSALHSAITFVLCGSLISFSYFPVVSNCLNYLGSSRLVLIEFLLQHQQRELYLALTAPAFPEAAAQVRA
jgi:hypothetical protein